MQPAHCVPTKHSSCPPEHCQHMDQKSQAMEILRSVISELVSYQRGSIRGGKRAWCRMCPGPHMPLELYKSTFSPAHLPLLFNTPLLLLPSSFFLRFFRPLAYPVFSFPHSQTQWSPPLLSHAARPALPVWAAADPAHAGPLTSLLIWRRGIKIFLAKPYKGMDD